VGELKKKLDAAEAVIRNFQKEYAENQPSDSTILNCPIQHDTRAEESIKHLGTAQRKPTQPAASNALPPEQIHSSVSRQDHAIDDTNAMNSDELMDINSATKNFEFHGSTSVVTLFNGLQKEQQSRATSSSSSPSMELGERQRSAVSEFHNDKFLGQLERHGQSVDISYEETYALHAFLFIDSYFKTLHFVHPILDQPWFLHRCNDLWAGRTNHLRQSFLALYFSVLSLGACVRIWTEDSINGMGRLEWSRLLFEKAEHALGRNGSINDLEAVQAPFILSLICQQQLELNLAYSFLGRAIRTAFSTGINRKVTFVDRNYPQDSPTFTVARTWWGLYNLEIELSFTLGRPDTLGMDSYHNRPLPPIDESENSIIPIMYQLSHIIRKVSAEIYLSHTRPDEKLRQATQIELELDQWLNNLPAIIRPPLGSSVEAMQSAGNIRNPYWPRLQVLILKISMYFEKRDLAVDI
jgi:Fungal specific transcription factor domain